MSTPKPRLLVVGNHMSKTVAHRDYCEDFSDRLEARGWSVIRTSTQWNKLLRLADMLRTVWAQRDHYDLAHVDVFAGNAFIWAEAVTMLLAQLRKPFILTLRGGALPTFAARWPRRARRLLNRANLVTTPSRYLATTMAPYVDGVTVIPNAVDISRIPYAARERVHTRLAWVRAFHAIYNPTMAIDVLSILAKTDRAATLTMVGHDKGDGSMAATRARVAELGLGDSVTIIPGVPKREVGQHLARHDVFVNTTTVDNTPVSVLEAMAGGLPVVSTNVGGIPYLVEDEHEALLTPSGDAPAMARAIQRIVADANLAGRLSAAGRDLARRCDWTPVLDRWEQVLIEVARDG